MSATLDFTEFSDDEEISVQKIKQRVILIVGLTGSGKSSIIRSLCSEDDEGHIIKAKMAVFGVTQNLNKYSNHLIVNPKDPNDKYTVTLVDTVGLGDHHVDVKVILKQIVDTMPKDLSTIHRIVFCFKMDRLRAKMSEELSIMYKFFKMLGAKPENFVMCLTFCDILNDQTINAFWNELKECQDLEMVKEVKTVTFTSFPNLDECDNDETLREYLNHKTRTSRRRIFASIIQQDAKPFHPHDAMIRLPPVDFDVLCSLLKSYDGKRRWYWGVINKTEQEDIVNQLIKWRPKAESGKDGKHDSKQTSSSMTTKVLNRVKKIHK